MARYEVVIAVYKTGAPEPLEEETVFESDRLSEAMEEFEYLIVAEAEDQQDGSTESDGEEPAVDQSA